MRTYGLWFRVTTPTRIAMGGPLKTRICGASTATSGGGEMGFETLKVKVTEEKPE